YKKTEV
nr:Chain B, postsynaptic protein CRIPT peptide [synthetic construct]